MADKLEALTLRLEHAITSMTERLESQLNRLERAVERLESLHGASSVQGGSSAPRSTSTVQSHAQPQSLGSAPVQSQAQSQQFPAFTEFNKLYSEWEEKAKATANQDIVELTNIALHLFRWSDSVIALANHSKKPSSEVTTNMSKYFGSKAREIDEKFLKPRKIENHAKTIKEGVGAALWILTDAPAIYLDGVIEPAVYNGNKIKAQRVPADTEWVDKFFALLNAFKSYAKENHQIGLTWKGKTEADFSGVLEGKISASPSKSSSSAAPEESKSSAPAAQTTQSQSAGGQPAFSEFNSLYSDWEEKAKATGNQDLVELTNNALHVFRWTDAILGLSSTVKKPSDEVLTSFNKYIGSKAKEIDDKFIRPRKLENQAKTVKEGLGAALWFLTEAPAVFIEGVIEPAMYNGNKVKMQKAPGEPEWVDKFIAILRRFKDYTKEHYQTGLTWKGKTEGDFTQLLQGQIPSGSSPTKPTQASAQGGDSAQAGRANLFADLNKGSAITQGLKVAERKPKGVVSTDAPLQPLSSTSSQQTAAKQQAAPVKKAPKTYLNNHWFIENYTDDRTIVMDEADMRQSVYIDNCHNCLIQVKGKVKSIMISNSSKLSLIFENTVSTVEAVNTKVLNIQATIHAPSIVLDKCERVKVYLAKNLETDIVSSKVTELNVSYLNEEDEFAKEFPVTEQFLTRWDPNHKKFVTKPMDLFIM